MVRSPEIGAAVDGVNSTAAAAAKITAMLKKMLIFLNTLLTVDSTQSCSGGQTESKQVL